MVWPFGIMCGLSQDAFTSLLCIEMAVGTYEIDYLGGSIKSTKNNHHSGSEWTNFLPGVDTLGSSITLKKNWLDQFVSSYEY